MAKTAELTTLASVQAAEAAVKNTASKRGAHMMVYLIEARVPLASINDFENEVLEDSLISYGSARVIDKGLVEGDA